MCDEKSIPPLIGVLRWGCCPGGGTPVYKNVVPGAVL